jgi:adenine-specific DNA-methyltransferase
MIELYQKPLSEIPLNYILEEKQIPFIDLVDQILEVSKNEKFLEKEELHKQISILEKQINQLVYNLYNLTSEEIKLIEEN